MYLDENDLLHLIDYNSKFIEIRRLIVETSAAVALKQFFLSLVTSRKIHTDSGPPFNSNAYLSYAMILVMILV